MQTPGQVTAFHRRMVQESFQVLCVTVIARGLSVSSGGDQGAMAELCPRTSKFN